MSTVVIPADFKLPIGFAAFGLAVTGLGNIGVGFPISVVGLLLAFQATRVSFEFDDVVSESYKSGSDVVGAKPRFQGSPWMCSSFPSSILPPVHSVYIHMYVFYL